MRIKKHEKSLLSNSGRLVVADLARRRARALGNFGPKW